MRWRRDCSTPSTTAATRRPSPGGGSPTRPSTSRGGTPRGARDASPRGGPPGGGGEKAGGNPAGGLVTPPGLGTPRLADVVVVGGGVMGSAAAWALARRDVGVVLLERLGPGHVFGASHGRARIYRNTYAQPHHQALVAEARRAVGGARGRDRGDAAAPGVGGGERCRAGSGAAA